MSPNPRVVFRLCLCPFVWAASLVSIAVAAEPGSTTFAVKAQLSVTVPEGAGAVRLWLPLPQEDATCTVTNLVTSVDAGANAPVALGKDGRGNEMGYVEIDKARPGEIVVVQTFELERRETLVAVDAAATRPLSAAEKAEHAADLSTDTYVPVNDTMKSMVETITAGETNPAVVARRLYDWMLANTENWVKDPSRFEPSPFGSAVYALSTRSGNAADLASLYTALARAGGVPARMVYGSLLKKPLDGVKRDAGTHAWVEVWFPGLGWHSVDVAVADMYAGPITKTEANEPLLVMATPEGTFGEDAAKAAWWFGNLDTRRVTWSRGRDLLLAPEQNGIPLNAFTSGYVEIDGREFTAWTRTVIFQEGAAAAAAGPSAD